MREVLFRGKSKHTGEWVTGAYVNKNWYPDRGIVEEANIISYEDGDECLWHLIIPETVGQYTGLTDKNGNKIFEGDIIKHYCNCEDKTIFDVGQIYWCENICQYRRTSRIEGQFYDIDTSCEYEVIGNIHDNSELLKGGAE